MRLASFALLLLTSFAAKLTVFCDDTLEGVNINGQSYTNLPNAKTWYTADVVTFTSARDVYGKDSIIITCKNAHNIGGVTGTVTYSPSDSVAFPSNSDRLVLNMRPGSSWTFSKPSIHQHETLKRKVMWGSDLKAPGPYVFYIDVEDASCTGNPKCSLPVQVPSSSLTVTESSTKGPWSYMGVTRHGEPEAVLDGNTGQYFYEGGTCLHTDQETRPYVRIDLGRPRRVHSIRIYGRMDGCCACRSRKLKLYSSWTGNFNRDKILMAEDIDAAVSGGKLVKVNRRCGRYLFIERNFENADCRGSPKGYLDFCEVKVFECGAPSMTFGGNLWDALVSKLW